MVYLLPISNGKKDENRAGGEVVDEYQLDGIPEGRNISQFKRDYMLMGHRIS